MGNATIEQALELKRALVASTLRELEQTRASTFKTALGGVWLCLPTSREMAGALAHAMMLLNKPRVGDKAAFQPINHCEVHSHIHLATVSPFYLVPQPGDDRDGIFESPGNLYARVTIYNGDGAKICTVG